ncbi:MAG: hypothetical protein H6669_07895 [Ardenticatenaceae bacterium]|nr:hypothetical protein [Ardenticatenaceae bacterium]
MKKLGVLTSTVSSRKDRFDLAMRSNNILTCARAKSWIEGEPLDVAQMLYDASGKPRHTIFYIAHLNDAERMFFVTLLYSAVEAGCAREAEHNIAAGAGYFDDLWLPAAVGGQSAPSKTDAAHVKAGTERFGVRMVLARKTR